jgi:hypothetical protein
MTENQWSKIWNHRPFPSGDKPPSEVLQAVSQQVFSSIYAHLFNKVFLIPKNTIRTTFTDGEMAIP